MPGIALGDWLSRLESLHPEEIELGLERVRSVALRLDCLDLPGRVVTVAGTNGKGSVIAVLEHLAVAAGLKVASYTSPHLRNYNERVRLDRVPVDDARLVEAFEAVEQSRGDTPLTYFEFGTLAALWIFKRSQPDIVLLEVGLGGRLDAVNIVDPEIAVITSISLDHQSWLGDDRETIGLEKAGIARPGIPVVLAESSPPQSVLRRLRELDCQVVHGDSALASMFEGQRLRPENVAAAWRVAELLGFAGATAAFPGVLQGLELPGRLQLVERAGYRVLLDVAHNEAAVNNLARHLDNCVTGRRIALFAVLSDKDIHAMIRSCRGRFDAWIICALPGVPRAAAVKDVAQILADTGEQRVSCCESPEAAWKLAREGMEEGDTLVIFGSFYTVAGFLPLLEEERSTA